MIAFLTKSFEEGSSYGTLNSDRCAISLISSNKIGEIGEIGKIGKIGGKTVFKGLFQVEANLC